MKNKNSKTKSEAPRPYGRGISPHASQGGTLRSLPSFAKATEGNKSSSGITLLLVVLVTSALMTVSLGIFNIIFIEFRISGEAANSFQALYAADQMLELALYKDRVQQSICTSGGVNCYVGCASGVSNCIAPTETFPTFSNGGCARVAISKLGGQTTVRSTGQFDCAADSLRIVRRAFEVSY